MVQFSNMAGYLEEFFPEFVLDPYRITLELSSDQNVMILAW